MYSWDSVTALCTPASPGTPQIHMHTDPTQLDRNVYSYKICVDGLDYAASSPTDSVSDPLL